MDDYSNAYITRKGLNATLRTLNRVLKPHLGEFEAIVVSGLSGIIPAAIMAAKWKKQLVVVRKDDERTHGVAMEGAAFWPEQPGFKKGWPYIVLDDFTARGNTLRRIYQALRNRGHDLPVYTVLYGGDYHSPVPMLVSADFTEPLNQWYVHGKDIEGSDHLFIPYVSTDLAGQKLNPDLWRPNVG